MTTPDRTSPFDPFTADPFTADPFPAGPFAPDHGTAATGPITGGANRRELFRRASLVALAGGGAAALAACGGTDSSAGTGTGGSSSGSSGGGSTSSGSGGQAAGTRFAKSDVPVGGGVIKDNVVVTQPTSGSYKAFSGICTHQHCPVSAVQDGIILCRCHGSEFSITDGSVQRGPANQPLPAKTVKESGSGLVVS